MICYNLTGLLQEHYRAVLLLIYNKSLEFSHFYNITCRYTAHWTIPSSVLHRLRATYTWLAAKALPASITTFQKLRSGFVNVDCHASRKGNCVKRAEFFFNALFFIKVIAYVAPDLLPYFYELLTCFLISTNEQWSCLFHGIKQYRSSIIIAPDLSESFFREHYLRPDL